MESTAKRIEREGGEMHPDTKQHKKRLNPMWSAHRLEGKVKNMGIKNKGKQVRKSHQGK